MAKLKCNRHGRRVITVGDKFIHRNGAGDPCEGVSASIMGEEYTAKGIQQFGLVRAPRSVKGPDG